MVVLLCFIIIILSISNVVIQIARNLPALSAFAYNLFTFSSIPQSREGAAVSSGCLVAFYNICLPGIIKNIIMFPPSGYLVRFLLLLLFRHPVNPLCFSIFRVSSEPRTGPSVFSLVVDSFRFRSVPGIRSPGLVSFLVSLTPWI